MAESAVGSALAMRPSAERRGAWPGLLGLLLLWELAGQLRWVGDGALPAPTQVLAQFWLDRADYPAHLWGTVRTAFAGFVLGNLAALALGLLFVWWRPAQRLMAGVNVTLFAMPAIALVPILVIALEGDTPRVVLAALSVYYPTMVATVLGLTQVDERLCDLVRVYGGSRWTTLVRVRLRSGLPTLLAGLRVAAPAAVLGVGRIRQWWQRRTGHLPDWLAWSGRSCPLMGHWPGGHPDQRCGVFRG